jgi:acetyl-CoA acyltransferase
MKEAFIVAAARSGRKAPNGKSTLCVNDLAPSPSGALARPTASVEQSNLVLGCAMPEGSQGRTSRASPRNALVPDTRPESAVNRCPPALKPSPWPQRIMSGMADVASRSAESTKSVPMGGFKISPNPCLVDQMPDAYLAMS